MKVCILSGRYPVTKFESAINHKIYANTFGYDYINCNWPTKEKNLYFNKIHYILSYIDSYDYIVWIDDDAFFLDFEVDIMKYLPRGSNIMSVCESPSYKDLTTFFSSGQFILKSCAVSRSFLNEILTQDISKVEKWWTDDFGFYTKGDQDLMIYLFHNDERFSNKFTLHDYKKFNSRAENLFDVDLHKPLILHFTGTHKVKMKNYRKVQSELSLDSSLVPVGLLTDYNIFLKNKIEILIDRVSKCLLD